MEVNIAVVHNVVAAGEHLKTNVEGYRKIDDGEVCESVGSRWPTAAPARRAAGPGQRAVISPSERSQGEGNSRSTYLQQAGEGEGEQQRRVPLGARAHGVSEAQGAGAGSAPACRAWSPATTLHCTVCTSTGSEPTRAPRQLSRGVTYRVEGARRVLAAGPREALPARAAAPRPAPHAAHQKAVDRRSSSRLGRSITSPDVCRVASYMPAAAARCRTPQQAEQLRAAVRLPTARCLSRVIRGLSLLGTVRLWSLTAEYTDTEDAPYGVPSCQYFETE
ncbi:unnamed protein product [Colias eurytheme]|nr:unnamed protein product [Colias eurytheme]